MQKEPLPTTVLQQRGKRCGLLIDELTTFEALKSVQLYLSGFDPALARFSLGTLLVGHAIEEAVREGAEEFDFLRGQEDYKYRWGAKDRLVYRRRFQISKPAHVTPQIHHGGSPSF